jgi:3-methyladenine DNA glycosylase AlkD
VEKNDINLNNLLKELNQKANKEKAKILAGFFKTGKGEYGEGDIFLGIVVPELRKLARKYCELSLLDTSKLIKNKYHEARLIALLVLVYKYKKSIATENVSKDELREDYLYKEKIVRFYLANTRYINNWDLVDLSAHYIIGEYLYQKTVINKSFPKTFLSKLAKSKNLWERRIAIISTFAFIYKGESELTLYIAKILLNDSHDLIHKACGWMLREVGKRVSEYDLTKFLDEYAVTMPRTMLRYAIERLPEGKRLYYLHKE